MRFPRSIDENGYATLVDVDEHGDADHGFTDGDAVLYDETMGVNGNATEVEARWFDDVTTNIKYACREGNGERGPEANALEDDPYELAAAMNKAATPLWGSSSFVASGLRFTTGGASLVVTLSAGEYVHEGRKYHATADRLSDEVVQVNAIDAGNGDEFTLRASRDHYISIAPDGDDAVSIQVRDVANGAGAPLVPDGHFVFAMLATDGSGVTSVFYSAPQKIATNDYGWEFAPAHVGFQEALIPVLAGSNIGALVAPDEYGEPEAAGGRFVGTVFAQRSHWRQHNSPGRRLDRVIDGETYSTTTSEGASQSIIIMDMDDLPNSSLVEFQAEVIGLSDVGQGFTTTIRRMCLKNSAGGMTIYGSTRVVSVDDPDTIGCTADFATIAGNRIVVTVTGAVGHDITWEVNVRSVQLRG